MWPGSNFVFCNSFLSRVFDCIVLVLSLWARDCSLDYPVLKVQFQECVWEKCSTGASVGRPCCEASQTNLEFLRWFSRSEKRSSQEGTSMESTQPRWAIWVYSRNLQWSRQGGSKAMDGERVYTYSPVPGPLPPYSFKLLTVYKNEDVRPGSF